MIQLNVAATLEGFKYRDILEAARALRPELYLDFWRTCVISFVARDARFSYHELIRRSWPPSSPTDPGIHTPSALSHRACHRPPRVPRFTPDTSIPIFPDARYRSDREAIRSHHEFLYSNCYHRFIARELNMRVRGKPERFGDGIAVRLQPGALMKLWDMMGSDPIAPETTRERDEPSWPYARSTAPLGDTADPREVVLSDTGDHVTALLGQEISSAYHCRSELRRWE